MKATYHESLTDPYTKILEFQATAACNFNRNTLPRGLRSTLQLDDWSKLLQEVKTKDVACKELMHVFDSMDQKSGTLLLQKTLSSKTQNGNAFYAAMTPISSSSLRDGNLRVAEYNSELLETRMRRMNERARDEETSKRTKSLHRRTPSSSGVNANSSRELEWRAFLAHIGEDPSLIVREAEDVRVTTIANEENIATQEEGDI